MNEDSLRENTYAQTMLYNGNEMEKESSDIARTYDVTAAAARIGTTDPEVISDGFYMDLMMTRGSDPAESKSTLGADHLAVKEVKPRSSQVAGRHAVIAFMEEEGDPLDLAVWTPWTKDSATRMRGLGGPFSDFSTLKRPALDEQDFDCDIYMLCKMLCPSRLRQWWPECKNIIGNPGGDRVRAAILQTSAVYYCISDRRSQL